MGIKIDKNYYSNLGKGMFLVLDMPTSIYQDNPWTTSHTPYRLA
jgi:hypothetical protein